MAYEQWHCSHQHISPKNMKLFNDTKVTFMLLWLSAWRKEDSQKRTNNPMLTLTSTHLIEVLSVQDGFKVQITGTFK